MTWTSFLDMHSGGKPKQPPYEVIYIELPAKMASAYFELKFGHDPEAIACHPT